MKKVFVGMSGGVDSSVSALLLKNLGYDVTGIFMKNWEDDECSSKDWLDAAAVADRLEIPLHTFNFAKEYKEEVFSYFLEEYKKGNTPNPDILCNSKIKFSHFFKKAKKLGADFIATGHYAQNIYKDKKHFLVKGKDLKKDQSYFLYTLKQDILKDLIFPIGHLEKKKVREIAKEHNLEVANKKDSTGICFIGKKDFRPFLSRYLAPKKGCIKDLEGNVVGGHMGAFLFTIGQRKGLNIGGSEKPYFVAKKDMKTNTIYVASGEDNPALFSNSLIANKITWVGDIPQKKHLKAKIRYRQSDQDCIIKSCKDNNLLVEFIDNQRAMAVSQSIVFYDGDICLGGGIIQKNF